MMLEKVDLMSVQLKQNFQNTCKHAVNSNGTVNFLSTFYT